jgi:hypothetical protein
MSMEIYVLSDRKLSSIEDWQRALNAEPFDLRLSTGRSFAHLTGYLPVRWGERQTGFECDHWDVADITNTYSDIEFGQRWSCALAFRWGGDLNACQTANMAATAYARATDGVVFDPAAARVLTPDQAAAVVRDMEKSLPSIEAALREIARRFVKPAGNDSTD